MDCVSETFLSILKDGCNRQAISRNIQRFASREWERLYKIAIDSRIWPVFYTRLAGLGLEDMPVGFLGRFETLYLFNLKRNLILERELLNVLACLEKNNIPAIPLKGPTMARFLYDDVALRLVSVDLDVLVRPEDVREAENKLSDIGYTFFSSQEMAAYYRKFYHEIMVCKFREQNQVMRLELHWDLFERPFSADLKGFWENSRRISLDGYKMLMPSLEDIIIYLSLSAIFNPRLLKIRYLYDLHQLLVKFKPEIDWGGLFAKVKQIKRQTAIFFSLKLCCDLFATDIPQDILDNLRPAPVKNYLCRKWFNKDNLLRFTEKDAGSETWNNFVGSYAYSRNTLDFLKIAYKKTFLPLVQANVRYGQPIERISYWVYLKRLLRLGRVLFLRR